MCDTEIGREFLLEGIDLLAQYVVSAFKDPGDSTANRGFVRTKLSRGQGGEDHGPISTLGT